MRRIIYTRPDGGLSVVVPVINTYPNVENITEAQAEQRAFAKLPNDALNARFVDLSEIPSDRTFRNAWTDTGAITHDMAKCREIHKDRLRAMREPKFEPLERAQRTALAAGDVVRAGQLEEQLQALRDVTADPALDAAQTPEDLKSIVPAILR